MSSSLRRRLCAGRADRGPWELQSAEPADVAGKKAELYVMMRFATDGTRCSLGGKMLLNMKQMLCQNLYRIPVNG
ncbi:hypothetical protein UY3_13144 [Chelonia mydas]|uniref:Uncharacterized protein n=1 Tax=Chelonia mydas TaxID=8469 RepID=M7AYG1_CHEMY|nr:hypothetical protein UY3_13144 [Chelonia mydas]